MSEALQVILNVHRAEFQPSAPPVASAPPVVDTGAIRAKHVKVAKSATSPFSRTARKSALDEAERLARAEATSLAERFERERAAWQASLDEHWAALTSNHPDTVLAVLADAFADNDAAAAALGVDGADATLIVLVPPPSSVPERRPTTTAAGNLSLKKLTKREAAELYKEFVCGHVLVTVKEAFAVAPALASARVVALRPTQPDAYGKVHLEVILAASFDKDRLSGVQWAIADAAQVLRDASTEMMLIQKGASRELQPIELANEPQLAELVATVDFQELT